MSVAGTACALAVYALLLLLPQGLFGQAWRAPPAKLVMESGTPVRLQFNSNDLLCART